ncbi:MAG: hypothetical protein IJ581_02885 [Paludibacteraceae bacterium]|nr:hypothetical protein [Paludibacteraceae bacterium]
MQEKLDPTYNDAVQAIKQAILNSQLRAARHINEEQLALYFGIGKYVSDNTREGKWGTNAIETISRQLCAELPGLRGFSATSLKFMRLFYEAWSPMLNSSATAVEMEEIKTSAVADEMQEIGSEAVIMESVAKKNHPFAEYDMTWSD